MKLPHSQNRKGLAFILLAVVCAFIAAGLVFAAGSKLAPSVPVLEAKTDITAGDPLNQGQFKVVKLPPAGLPEGAMTPNANLSNALAARGLTAGDVLRRNAIINLDAADPSLLSARLRALNNPALRAMEVPIEAAAGLLAGMKAGDNVDIISVSQGAPQQGSGQQKAQLAAKTVIGSAPVIGVRPAGQDAGVLVVALTTQQAETIALAREQGKVYVSLLPFGSK